MTSNDPALIESSEEHDAAAPYLLRNNTHPSREGDGAVNQNRDDDEEEEIGADDFADSTLSLDEVLYSASSYHAIAKPVTVTMILAALAVMFVQTEDSKNAGAAEMASYTVFKIDESGSTAENVKQSFLNALVIVSVIAIMTFGIVAVYKFRCMMCLIGYMIMSSCTLLGLLGGTMAYTAVQKFRIQIDWLSFTFLIYNFAIVGAAAIFFGRGIPMYITQGYLVCTSVILAWQLSNFDPWTTWALLVMLALYDLCAVLTPCGPLKALVNLMSEDDAPEMPGLLYEAHLGEGIRRPGGPPSGNSSNNNSNSRQQGSEQTSSGATTSRTTSTTSNQGGSNPVTSRETTVSAQAESAAPSASVSSSPLPSYQAPTTANPLHQNTTSSSNNQAAPDATMVSTSRRSSSSRIENTGFVPLAIARLYKLPLVSGGSAAGGGSGRQTPPPHVVSTSPLLQNDNMGGSSHQLPTPEELKADVEVIFPRNGGKIVRQTSNSFEPKYMVYGREGDLRRVLVVDAQGRVFQETDDDSSSSSGNSEEGPASIRLGLGDFIFYSVLVSQAAAYGFTTFIACMLVILAGLGGTLVLLSVYHKALPALPISIFLGVATYLLTRTVIEPWIEDLLSTPYYV